MNYRRKTQEVMKGVDLGKLKKEMRKASKWKKMMGKNGRRNGN